MWHLLASRVDAQGADRGYLGVRVKNEEVGASRVEGSMERFLPADRLNRLSRLSWVLFVLAIAACLGWAAYQGSLSGGQGYDSEAFSDAARAWIHGESVYAHRHVDFVYPPFAVLVMTPLGLLSHHAAWAVMMLLSVLALWGSIFMSLRLADVDVTRRGIIARLLTVAFLVFYPVLLCLNLGQVGLILMALVLLDFSIPMRRWPRGLLTGAAAAIKLTPAIFVMLFIARRSWRSCAVFCVSVAAFFLAGRLAMPQDDHDFFDHVFGNTERVTGSVSSGVSATLASVVARAMQPEASALSGSARVVWLAAEVIVLACAMVALVLLSGRRAGLERVALTGVTGCLVSPASWPHHWVWTIPAFIALLCWAVDMRSWKPALFAAVGFCSFAISPQWLFGTVRVVNGTNSWGPVQQLLGDMPVWWAIAFVVTYLVRTTRARGRNGE